jgi:phosphatidylglycerol:prolipoprotein diacylglycerol transferase
MYLVAFAQFYLLGRYRITHSQQPITVKQLDDMLFYGVLGVVLGGRLGYVFFYKFSEYMANPLDIFKVWQGGMSFHGGLLGVLVVIFLFCRKTKIPFFQLSDFVAPLVPLGIAVGRLGNFINGELWGRVTSPDAPWAMVFPESGMLVPRHPSQLYEMALEGIALFIILWFFSRKSRPTGQISALFLLGYGSFRFLVEFTREPDNFLGLLSLGLSMGQWLSLPMMVIGLIAFVVLQKKARVK